MLEQTDGLSENVLEQAELEHELLGRSASYKDCAIYEKILQRGPVNGFSGGKMTAHTPFTEALITVSTDTSGQTDH
jgi:hypothetical protein